MSSSVERLRLSFSLLFLRGLSAVSWSTVKGLIWIAVEKQFFEISCGSMLGGVSLRWMARVNQVDAPKGRKRRPERLSIRQFLPRSICRDRFELHLRATTLCLALASSGRVEVDPSQVLTSKA